MERTANLDKVKNRQRSVLHFSTRRPRTDITQIDGCINQTPLCGRRCTGTFTRSGRNVCISAWEERVSEWVSIRWRTARRIHKCCDLFMACHLRIIYGSRDRAIATATPLDMRLGDTLGRDMCNIVKWRKWPTTQAIITGIIAIGTFFVGLVGFDLEIYKHYPNCNTQILLI